MCPDSESFKGLFTDVDSDKYFWLCNGQPIKNLSELVNILKDLDNETFSFHVNSEKNDFAAWIKNVIDNELGQKILRLKDKNKIIKAIENRLKKESNKDKPSIKQKLPLFTFKKGKLETDISDIQAKLNEILKREKEIEAKERIIRNIEARIEKKLEENKKQKFFSKEFVEGILIGILILLVCGLIYIKFFMPY